MNMRWQVHMAEAIGRPTLAVRRVLGDHHPDTLTIRDNFALVPCSQ